MMGGLGSLGEKEALQLMPKLGCWRDWYSYQCYMILNRTRKSRRVEVFNRKYLRKVL